MMKSALLFYRKLVADLRSIGFDLNPYDLCVPNKIINGHQITICWHVDDLLLATRIVMLSLVLLNGFNNGTKPLTNPLRPPGVLSMTTWE
jgi:hypothetical protein